MGLTVHYWLQSRVKTDAKAAEHVHRMRELARDLPFEEVGEIVSLDAEQIAHEREREDPLRWMLIQSERTLQCPWNPRIHERVKPTRLIAFTVWPGRGCEDMNIGLCQYPATVDWDYRPSDDRRFERNGEFCHRKWRRYREQHFSNGFPMYDAVLEQRAVPTKMGGWRWGSFCKTQYASDPACGGIANFLRCHISVVTLLERIGKLPGIKLRLNDEGHYGPSYYSDDWREAYAANRKPTHTWHAGEYSVKSLVAEIGEWNEMIAAFVGRLTDRAEICREKVSKKAFCGDSVVSS